MLKSHNCTDIIMLVKCCLHPQADGLFSFDSSDQSDYGCLGGDWGSMLSKALGLFHSDHCKGIHVNLLAATPSRFNPWHMLQSANALLPYLDQFPIFVTAEEISWLKETMQFQSKETGKAHSQLPLHGACCLVIYAGLNVMVTWCVIATAVVLTILVMSSILQQLLMFVLFFEQKLLVRCLLKSSSGLDMQTKPGCSAALATTLLIMFYKQSR